MNKLQLQSKHPPSQSKKKHNQKLYSDRSFLLFLILEIDSSQISKIFVNEKSSCLRIIPRTHNQHSFSILFCFLLLNFKSSFTLCLHTRSAHFYCPLDQMDSNSTDISVGQPIVIDNGSGVLKAGFAEEEKPSCIIPNYIGRPKYNRIPSMKSDIDEDKYLLINDRFFIPSLH